MSATIPVTQPTPTAAIRQVTLALSPVKDGRIPLTLKVVPTANFDASGGIFVDLRLGSKDPADLPTVIDRTASESGADTTPDIEAVASVADSALPPEAAASARVTAVDLTAAMPQAVGKHHIVSHQISKAHKVTTGQAETFQAAIAVPAPSPDGEHWYVRGRFASTERHDLKSIWTRLPQTVDETPA